jgi:lysylphosphatidylglycerol synthetase-like protein (DUF2156 family)
MAQNIFKIRRAFLVPFITIVVLLCLLFLFSLFRGQMWEKIVLAVSFTGTLLIAIEATRRKIVLTDDGLEIKKFFRTKEFSWPEITHLALLICAKKSIFY